MPCWDLYAKVKGKPLWRLLAEMSPEQIVAAIDFRYIDDALSPDEALELLRRQEPFKQERIAQIKAEGLPAYTTSVGWFGFDDEKGAPALPRGTGGRLDPLQAQGGR